MSVGRPQNREACVVVLYFFVIAAGCTRATQTRSLQPPTPAAPKVRMISVQSGVLVLSSEEVLKRLRERRIALEVEKPLGVSAVEQARRAIEEMCAERKLRVGVESHVAPTRPGNSVEVRFVVTETRR